MNEASHSLERLAAATGRLLATATGLSDAQVPPGTVGGLLAVPGTTTRRLVRK